jgi:arginase family enzyme
VGADSVGDLSRGRRQRSRLKPLPQAHGLAGSCCRQPTTSNRQPLHVSFDVDFLDPEIAPGVGTTVPGGPNYREAQLCMEMISDTGLLASLDVVELNPAFDDHNRTARLAVDLIESLFGKSTLMRPRG